MMAGYLIELANFIGIVFFIKIVIYWQGWQIYMARPSASLSHNKQGGL